MRELVLIQPGRVLVGRSEREEESSRSHREFEERLAECGPLAYRVAYGVLRHAADAEDVAQEALLNAAMKIGFSGRRVQAAFCSSVTV